MPTLYVNDTHLYYEIYGEGKETLVFSHGYLMDHSMFAGQIDILRKYFRCFVYDHRGHGKSKVHKKDETTDYSMQTLVIDAALLIQHLNLGPVHFVGMSTGGFVGLRLALWYPLLLRSLFIMNSSAEAEPPAALKKNNTMLWVAQYLGWFPVIYKVLPILFHSSFLKDPHRRKEVNAWRKKITRQKLKGIVPFGKGIMDRKCILKEIHKITHPTGVLSSADDIPTPPEKIDNIAHRIPNVWRYHVTQAGHSVAIEKPDEVTYALMDFYIQIKVLGGRY